jgi:hypothetical protein
MFTARHVSTTFSSFSRRPLDSQKRPQLRYLQTGGGMARIE